MSSERVIPGLSGLSSARYDLEGRGPFKLSYAISASFRSGSTHLCTCLWRTGLLGAPFEYFNYEHELKSLWMRLGAVSWPDFLDKLLACRRSDNGVFGFKAHFQHFDVALREYPQLMSRLGLKHFIFIQRADKIAQAVSLAKAYQTRAWIGLGTPLGQTPLFYSREFIAACLKEIATQELRWQAWFSRQQIEPHVVLYEDLLSHEREVVGEICDRLGVAADAPSTPRVPSVARQSDSINADWIVRFKRGE